MSDKKTEKLFQKAVSAVRAKKGRGLVFGAKLPTTVELGIAGSVLDPKTGKRIGHYAPAKGSGYAPGKQSVTGSIVQDGETFYFSGTSDYQPYKTGHRQMASVTLRKAPQKKTALGFTPKRKSNRKRRALGYQPYRGELAHLVDSLRWGPTLAPVGAARAKQILSAALLPNAKLPRPGQEILVDKYKDADPWSRSSAISLYLENNAGRYLMKVLGGQIDDYLEPKQVSPLIRERMTASA